jgi:hypothetical protein
MESTLTPYFRKGLLTYVTPDGTTSSVNGQFRVVVNGYGEEIVWRWNANRHVAKVFAPLASVHAFVPKVGA